MKKAYSVLVAFLFLFQTHAFAAHDSIKRILDEYHYSVEVIWDQQNQRQLDEINLQFEKALDVYLARHSGEEMVQELLQQIQDPAIKAKVIEAIMSARDQESLRLSLSSIYEQSKMQGAQWSTVGKVALGAVGILALSYIAVRVYMHEWGKRF